MKDTKYYTASGLQYETRREEQAKRVGSKQESAREVGLSGLIWVPQSSSWSWFKGLRRTAESRYGKWTKAHCPALKKMEKQKEQPPSVIIPVGFHVVTSIGWHCMCWARISRCIPLTLQETPLAPQAICWAISWTFQKQIPPYWTASS